MGGNKQSQYFRKEDETKHKTANTSRSFFGIEFGSDDADRRLNQGGSEELLHGWMQSSLFSEPKPLIYTDESGHLAICDETLMQISAITWKLVIVGIAGPYRCGKSFLMNRLAGKSKGFFVGNSTNAVTKGIWAWCNIHPKQERTVLLLLDTEGLGDIRKGNRKHDNKILTLITLLCNVLVFNMMGRFDEDSISKLSFATQISKSVKFGSEAKNQYGLPIVMPDLILCLRDFFLEFDDDIATPNMYFEDCLKDVEGEDEYNAPRQSLKTFFPIRHCFTFPRPADESTMKNLENAKENKLSKSFLQTSHQFKLHIFSCKPKTMHDSEFSVHGYIDGSLFKGLLEYHIKCIREGNIPDIEDAFFTVSRKENEKVMQQVKDEFQKTMDGIRLPADSLDDFHNTIRTAWMECLHMCREKMNMDKDYKQEKQLQIELQKIWDDMTTENAKRLQDQFAENLMKKYSSSFKKTRSVYLKEICYQQYKKELDQLKMDFEERLDPSLFSEFSLAWTVFMNRIRDDEMFVLESDLNLTKAEKEGGIQELKDLHSKALKKQKDKNKEKLDELQLELKTERANNYADQINKIREELQRYQGLGVWERVKFLFTGNVADD